MRNEYRKNEKILYGNQIHSDELDTTWYPNARRKCCLSRYLENWFWFTKQVICSHFFMVHIYHCMRQFATDEELD